MAKLSARGRSELCRLTKTKQRTQWFSYGTHIDGVWTAYTEPQAYTEPRGSDVVQERLTYTLMSDTHVLFKLDCTWHDGQKHTYNWTDKGKSKLTRQQFVDRLVAKGYTLKEGN